MTTENLISIDEAAREAKVTRRTIHRMINDGRLKKYKDRERTYIDIQELKKYINNQSTDIEELKSKLYLRDVHLWDKKYGKDWRSFVDTELRKDEYDLIILGDRMGSKLCDITEVIPPEFKYKTIFSSALDFLTEKELQNLLYNKKILIIDDLFQHGRTFYKTHKVLQKYGVKKSNFIVCAQNIDCVKKGLVKYSNVKACYKFQRKEFREFTSLLNSKIYYIAELLDNDHIQIKFKIGNEDFSLEDIAAYFSNMGKIHFPPQRHKNGNSFIELTINKPYFFNFHNIILPSEIVESGAFKIRILFSKSELRIVPITIAHLYINPQTFGTKSEKINPFLYEFCKPILEHKKFLEPQNLSLLYYEALLLYLSAVMAFQFINEINIESIIKIEKSRHNVRREDLLRRYGSTIGNAWHDILENVIYTALNNSQYDIGIKNYEENDLIIEEDYSGEYTDPINLREIIDKFKKAYKDAQTTEKTFPGLDFNELIKRTGLGYKEVSKGVDYSVDRPFLKSRNEASQKDKNSDEYFCRRPYELTENFGIDRNQSDAYVEPELLEKKANALIPYVISNIGDKWLNQKGEKKSSPPTLLYKSIANLLHIASGRRPFYLDWEPYIYGPIPCIRKYVGSEVIFDEEKKPIFLWNYSKIAGTYHYDKDKNEFYVDNSEDVKEGIRENFKATEKYIIDGYLNVLKHIWHHDNKTNKTLIILAALRNLKLAYIHARKEVDIWSNRFSRFLYYIKTNLDSLSKTKIQEFLEEMAEVPRELCNKIDMYLDLEKTYNRLEKLFENNPEIETLGAQILEDIELPINYTDRGKYPLANAKKAGIVMEAFTKYILSCFKKHKLFDDPEELIKENFNWYNEHLLHVLKENSINYKYVPQIDDQISQNSINNEFVHILREQFKEIIVTIKRKEFLPDSPKSYESDSTEQVPHYNSILSIYSELPSEYHHFRTIGCIDLVKMTPYLEGSFNYSHKDINEHIKSINKQFFKYIKETSRSLKINSFVQISDNDKFLVVTEKPESMVKLLIEVLNNFGRKESSYIIPNISLDYALEDSIFKGEHFSSNAIYASLICEDKHIDSKGGTIFVTKEFFLSLPDDLQSFCEVYERDYIIDSEGKLTDIYIFNWEMI